MSNNRLKNFYRETWENYQIIMKSQFNIFNIFDDFTFGSL